MKILQLISFLNPVKESVFTELLQMSKWGLWAGQDLNLQCQSIKFIRITKARYPHFHPLLTASTNFATCSFACLSRLSPNSFPAHGVYWIPPHKLSGFVAIAIIALHSEVQTRQWHVWWCELESNQHLRIFSPLHRPALLPHHLIGRRIDIQQRSVLLKIEPSTTGDAASDTNCRC